MWGTWTRKWLTHERLATCKDGDWRWPRKTLSTFCSFWRNRKALYWKGKWPCWTWCHVTSLFFKPPSQQFPRLMNQIASSDLCLTVAVACRVINHRYRAAVDPHANAHCAIFFAPPQKLQNNICMSGLRDTLSMSHSMSCHSTSAWNISTRTSNQQ